MTNQIEYEIKQKQVYVYQGAEFNSPEEVEAFVLRTKVSKLLELLPDYKNTQEFVNLISEHQPAAFKAFCSALVFP